MQNYQQAFSNLSGGRVLDVATGGGNFIEVLSEHLRDFETFTGIDQSDHSRAVFEQSLAGLPATFIKMDGVNLQFADASFDTVSLSNSLHHLADIPLVLAEMKRVLKPGGHFIISEMYCDGQSEPQQTHVLIHHWFAAVDTTLGLTHRQTYTRQQLFAIIQSLNPYALAIKDVADPQSDPKDPENIRFLEARLAETLLRLDGLPPQGAPETEHARFDELRAQAETLRQRLNRVGFRSATTLVAVFQA